MAIRGPDFRALAAAVLALLVAASSLAPRRVRADQDSLATPGYAQELGRIRDRILAIEGELSGGLRSRRSAKANLRELKKLVALRRRERELCKSRLQELEDTVRGLDARRESVGREIKAQQASVRRFLIAVELSTRLEGLTDPMSRIRSIHLPDSEKVEAPRRKLLANLAARGLKELEILRADLDDAGNIQGRIQDEKQQLAYFLQDLDEKKSALRLDQRIQAEYFRKGRETRLAQFDGYGRLESSESQVERLIRDFNARLELERADEADREMGRLLSEGAGFASVKGRLGLPVADGKVISTYGRAFDPRSRLYIFKKGIDILAGPDEPVRAVFPGKIAFSGELPEYGQITIIDHGDHYYSLCAHLGRVTRREGDAVAAGDPIGATDGAGTPVYFEIRSRNVPVNPLQWLSSSINLE